MKLTATGLPFGEGSTTVQRGAYDWIWKRVKAAIVESDAFEGMKKLFTDGKKMNIHGIMEHTFKAKLRDSFPSELTNEDYNRYMDELMTILDESSRSI